jgi:hypothetical protein
LGERRMDRDEQNAKQEDESSFHGTSLSEMLRRGANATPTGRTTDEPDLKSVDT